MRYLTIALAKGRLASKAMDMFEQISISRGDEGQKLQKADLCK